MRGIRGGLIGKDSEEGKRGRRSSSSVDKGHVNRVGGGDGWYTNLIRAKSISIYYRGLWSVYLLKEGNDKRW